MRDILSRGANARTTATALFALLLAGSGGAASAAPQSASGESLLGLWRTDNEYGAVELFVCKNAVCGRVVDGAALREDPDQRDVNNPDPSLRERRVKGLVVLENFTGGPRKWSGGPLYDPKTGDGAKRGRLILEDAGTLKVQGCIAAFLCRTQVWTRIGAASHPA